MLSVDAPSWQLSHQLQTPRYGFGMAIDSSDRVYVAGGTNGDAVLLGSVEVLDPSDESTGWANASSLMAPRGWGPAMCVLNDFLYVAGGFDFSAYNVLSSVESLSTSAAYDGAWGAVSDMQESRAQFACAVLNGEKLFVAGGVYCDDNRAYCEMSPSSPTPYQLFYGNRKSVEVYDDTLDEWTLLSSTMTVDRSFFGQSRFI